MSSMGGGGPQDFLQGQWGLPCPSAHLPLPVGWESLVGTAELRVTQSLGEKAAEAGFPWGSSPPDCPGAGAGFPWREVWGETILRETDWICTGGTLLRPQKESSLCTGVSTPKPVPQTSRPWARRLRGTRSPSSGSGAEVLLQEDKVTGKESHWQERPAPWGYSCFEFPISWTASFITEGQWPPEFARSFHGPKYLLFRSHIFEFSCYSKNIAYSLYRDVIKTKFCGKRKKIIKGLITESGFSTSHSVESILTQPLISRELSWRRAKLDFQVTADRNRKV